MTDLAQGLQLLLEFSQLQNVHLTKSDEYLGHSLLRFARLPEYLRPKLHLHAPAHLMLGSKDLPSFRSALRQYTKQMLEYLLFDLVSL